MNQLWFYLWRRVHLARFVGMGMLSYQRAISTTDNVWQIFWVSLIVEGALEIAAIALLLANNIPDAVSKTTNKWSILHIRLDSLGTFFSISGLILLVYGLTTGNVHGWDKADVIATLVIAVALLAISVFVELKVSSDSILPRYRWGDRIKVLGCAVASRTYAVWQGSN